MKLRIDTSLNTIGSLLYIRSNSPNRDLVPYYLGQELSYHGPSSVINLIQTITIRYTYSAPIPSQVMRLSFHRLPMSGSTNMLDLLIHGRPF